MSLDELYFDSALMKAIAQTDCVIPDDIQQQLFPVLMDGKDLLAAVSADNIPVCILPIFHHLLTTDKPPSVGPRILILVSTRELAFQLLDFIKEISRNLNLKSGIIVGGSPYFNQQKLLKRPLDFLVATPGRLLEHTTRNPDIFARLQYLVLGDTDSMIDLGLLLDIKKAVALVPEERQTILLTKNVQDKSVQHVSRLLLNEPVTIEVAANISKQCSGPAVVNQYVYNTEDAKQKHNIIAQILRGGNNKQVLVLTSSNYRADRLFRGLKRQGLHCCALHENTDENYKMRFIESFSQKKTTIMVTTFSMSHLIDIRCAHKIIFFDLPQDVDNYMHAVRSLEEDGGEVISITTNNERPFIARLERGLGQKLIKQQSGGGGNYRNDKRSRQDGRYQNEGRSGYGNNNSGGYGNNRSGHGGYRDNQGGYNQAGYNNPSGHGNQSGSGNQSGYNNPSGHGNQSGYSNNRGHGGGKQQGSQRYPSFPSEHAYQKNKTQYNNNHHNSNSHNNNNQQHHHHNNNQHNNGQHSNQNNNGSNNGTNNGSNNGNNNDEVEASKKKQKQYSDASGGGRYYSEDGENTAYISR